VCYQAVTRLKARFGYDDSLDVFGVHGVGSSLGMLLLGLLATSQVNDALVSTCKINGQVVPLAGGGAQLVNQLKGVLFTIAFAGIATFVILKVVNAVTGLRLTEEQETLGMDLSQHGESAYND
jgi:Amt family ammonium transporter